MFPVGSQEKFIVNNNNNNNNRSSVTTLAYWISVENIRIMETSVCLRACALSAKLFS